MRNVFSGGVNAILMMLLVTFYIVLNRSDAIRESLVDITGSWGAFLLPVTFLLSAKIAFNFASRFAIPIIIACGLAVQASFAGILSLWQVRWILLFNPPVSNVALDDYLSLDDVHVAGGYLGRFLADVTIGVLMKFPSVRAMDISEALSFGMTGLGVVIIGVACVALLFLPDGRTTYGHKDKGHGKGRKGKVVNIVN